MSAEPATPLGRFVWHELFTTDIASASAFYAHVVGWGVVSAPEPNAHYTLFTMDGTPVAGMMAQPPRARESGTPPSWFGHVSVPDVDDAAARATRLGGVVHVPPTDIPTVGRFAVIADPQGAVLMIFAPSDPFMMPPEAHVPGHFRWNQLNAADWNAVFPFYERILGWRKADAIDMGAAGLYQIFAAGDGVLGGMFDDREAGATPRWLYYVAVADIDAAQTRIGEAGGVVTAGPHQAPGGDFILHATDGQDVPFALVGPRA